MIYGAIEIKNKIAGMGVNIDMVWPKFEIYRAMLEKWNPTINLVAKSTLDQFWHRHLLDSAQLYQYIDNPSDKIVIDMGSGAGFPGLVLAMMGTKATHLIESDSRKCSFLQNLAAQTGTTAKIHAKRIEDATIFGDVVTARALASLGQLIDYAKDKLNPNGVCIFLKGRDWAEELADARKKYEFVCQDFASLTDAEGRVVKMSSISALEK